MQALPASITDWLKSATHSNWFYGLSVVCAFLFWRILINSPVWFVGKMLAIYYTPKRLSTATEISPESSKTHIIVKKPPSSGYLPSLRNLNFKVLNTLRFFDVEIRRADVDVWMFQQAFISRERFIGEVVKSTRLIIVEFNIDLDELRLARLKDFLSPPEAASLTLAVKLTMKCATFFRKFEVARDFQILTNIYH